MSWFEATAAGIEVTLQAPEIAVLYQLSGLLGGAGVERDDPARVRLTPQIYSDDATASREFDRLADRERVESRAADREAFNDGLDTAVGGVATLSTEEAAGWARVIGEARIVLAARKGFFEDGMPTESVGDPEVALVMFLGAVLEDLVEAMLMRMEDAT